MDINHATELLRHAEKIGRPAGDIPAVMNAAAAHIEHLERELRAAEIRLHDVATLCANVESELEAERAEREKQEPVAYLTADKNMLVFADKCVDMKHLMTPLYDAPPVAAPVRLTDEDLFQEIEVAGIPIENVALACAIKDLGQDAVLRANGFDIQPTRGED